MVTGERDPFTRNIYKIFRWRNKFLHANAQGATNYVKTLQNKLQNGKV